MQNRNGKAIVYAVLAAVFYAVSIPFSKILLAFIPSVMMAGFLYLGAGAGIGILFWGSRKEIPSEELLSKKDTPYVLGMILLDIAAPVLLMYGLTYTSSANASLLGNFEIVATAVIARIVFKEGISKRLWLAIALVTLSCMLLSFEGSSVLVFSGGSVLVLGAALCWGFENNCTRSISMKNTYQIVMLKGICSGTASLVIALWVGESVPPVKWIAVVMILGFVAYGLSIFYYIKAQSVLGAAKTSAYYAMAPFIGALLAFLLLKEDLSGQYLAGLLFMIAGTATATMDSLILHHRHMHTHMVTHSHNGKKHTHAVTHSHEHHHYGVGVLHGNEETPHHGESGIHHHIHTVGQLHHSHLQ